jgi:transketolase
LRQKEIGFFNTYTLLGDGELQEGSCWESIFFAAQHKLNNLCVIIDKNNGQSDDSHKLLINTDNIGSRFETFGFNVLYADSSNIHELLACLEKFTTFPLSSKPTVIICESYKGFGGYSINASNHKHAPNDEECDSELEFLGRRRAALLNSLNNMDLGVVENHCEALGYHAEYIDGRLADLIPVSKKVNIIRPAKREKALCYNQHKLPKFSIGELAAPTDVTIAFSRVFAQSPLYYSIDADLSNVSGLYTGTALTNRIHAINVGIAECNMMNMAEGLAVNGANVWVSTFGVFFNTVALRRICVSYQERMETIESESGWLSEGHNLDITFLATASNIDTGVNGATHMCNDDINIVGQLAHLKIIDTSCPQQLISVAKWVAEGNRGLVYLRTMRNASPVLYDSSYIFEYGKGYFLRGGEDSIAAVVTSGHGVLEAITAAEILEKDGISVAVIDMPSYDSELLGRLVQADKTILFAEQNNGWLFDTFSRDCLQNQLAINTSKILQLSTRDNYNRLQFIQSGTYEQIRDVLSLCPDSIALKLKSMV